MITPPFPFPRFAAILAGSALLTGPAAFADSATWNNPSGANWATGSNWTPTTAPGATSGTTNEDTATFLASTLTGNRTINIDANRNLKNITFDFTGYSGTFAYSGVGNNASGSSLLLSSGGIIELKGALNKSSGFSNSGFSAVAVNPQSIVLQGDYTFSANSTNTGSTTGVAQLFISSASTVSGASGLGNVTLKLTGQTVSMAAVATGDNIANQFGGGFNGKITNGTGNTLSIVKEGVGAWSLANNSNDFSGGVTIKEGSIVVGADNALGTGGATLGESASAQNAYLLLGSGRTVANALTVNSGSGLRVLGANNQSGDATYSGAITLNGGAKLRLQKASSNNVFVSGGITGTGNVEVYNNASADTGVDKGVVFKTNAINNAGTVTNASPGVGTLTQTEGGIIGSNVTAFIQNSATSMTTLTLANSYGETNILAGTLATAGTGTLGTGNVTVNGGSLILGSSISLNDNATLSFLGSGSGTIALNNLDADTVYAIYDITTGTYAGVSTWTAAELNDFFGTSVFTGDGQLTTLAAIPEPGTMSLAFFALGMVVLHLRRRRQSQPTR